MKIGLVIYGSMDIVSGGYLYDRMLVGYLRSRGDDVRVISLRQGTYLSHLLSNIWVRFPPDLDILIADELVHPSLLLANRSRRDPPAISLIHNLRSSELRPAWQNAFYRQIEKWHLAPVGGYIFNSAATRDSVLSLFPMQKPYVIAPPGGDRLGGLTYDALEQRLARAGPLRLLFLANVTPLKGLHVLLDALRDLPPDSFTLDIAGSLTIDAAYAGRMRAQAASLSIPVTFHGVLTDAPLIHLLESSDVLVLPSFYEGFGIAYLEGMAHGLPAIGTTAGAIPQMITHGLNGYLIAPGHSASLAALLQNLVSDRALLRRMSHNALRFFLSCPTWEQSAEKARDFLLKMVAGRGSQQA